MPVVGAVFDCIELEASVEPVQKHTTQEGQAHASPSTGADDSVITELQTSAEETETEKQEEETNQGQEVETSEDLEADAEEEATALLQSTEDRVDTASATEGDQGAKQEPEEGDGEPTGAPPRGQRGSGLPSTGAESGRTRGRQ